MTEIHELTHSKDTIGYDAAMCTLTFIGFEKNSSSRFSDMGIPANWDAYVTEFDRLDNQQEQLDDKIEEIHAFIARAHTHQYMIRQYLDRLYAELAELVPVASPRASNRRLASRSPGA